MRALSVLCLATTAAAVSQVSDVTVLLYDNKPEEGTSAPLEQQLRQGGWKWAQVGHVGKFEGFGQKIQAVLDAVTELPPDAPVVVADAYDVLINSHPNSAQHASEQLNALLNKNPGSIIVGAEAQCCVSALSRATPGSLISDEGARIGRTCSSGAADCTWVNGGDKPWTSFMKTLAQQRGRGANERNAYLNAGAVAGRAGDIAMLYAAMQADPAEDDQALMTELLFRRPEKFTLDYDQVFFGNNRWGEGMSGCLYEPLNTTGELKEHDTFIVTDDFTSIDMAPFKAQTIHKGQQGKILRLDASGFALIDVATGSDKVTVIVSKNTYSKLRVQHLQQAEGGALRNRETGSAPAFLHTSGKFYECFRHLAEQLNVKPSQTHYRKVKPLNYQLPSMSPTTVAPTGNPQKLPTLAPTITTLAPQSAAVQNALQNNPNSVANACTTALQNLQGGNGVTCTVQQNPTGAPTSAHPTNAPVTLSPTVDPLSNVAPGQSIGGGSTVSSTQGTAQGGATVTVSNVADCEAATLETKMVGVLNAMNLAQHIENYCIAATDTPHPCNMKVSCGTSHTGTGDCWYWYKQGSDTHPGCSTGSGSTSDATAFRKAEPLAWTHDRKGKPLSNVIQFSIQIPTIDPPTGAPTDAPTENPTVFVVPVITVSTTPGSALCNSLASQVGNPCAPCDTCVQIDLNGQPQCLNLGNDCSSHAPTAFPTTLAPTKTPTHGARSGCFMTYPDYSGNLHVQGSFTVTQTASGSLVVDYNVQGADPACSSVGTAANSCGIHIHSGNTCHDHNLVGGHFYSVNGPDPWSYIHATVSPDGTAVGSTTAVYTGDTLQQVVNRVMVIHDHNGARIGCGILDVVGAATCTASPTTASPVTPTTGSPVSTPVTGAPIQAGVNGDPFTTFNGKRTQFYLPIHVETKIIQCEQRVVYAATMPSGLRGDSQQWFESIRVANDGEDIVSVAVTRAEYDHSIKGNASYFDADDIAMRAQKALSKTRVAPGDAIALLNVTVAGESVKSVGTKVGPSWVVEVVREEPELPGYGKTETVTVSLGSEFELQINAAVAKKFVSEREQLEKLHLDMSFKDLKAQNCIGLLPEIWGVRPMSQTTLYFLEPHN